ncbi:DUF4906 domain-containing protein, partial [uncultured Rikenella sp.]|uniref:DUF4906 domain-containing protein n=1 Tax=uncultured Rikenella sp. TaxID=368003 RepID=UPI00261D3A1C
MKRLMIFAVAAVGITLASCSKSELQVPDVYGKPNALPVHVSLTPEALSGSFGPVSEASLTKTAAAKGDGMEVTYGEADTKSTTELTNPAQDAAVFDVWAIQFDKNGALIGQPYYTDDIPTAGTASGVDATYNLSVNLTTYDDAGGKVFFIANTGSASFFNGSNAANINTLAKTVKSYTNEYKPTAASGLPMLGVYTGKVSSAAAIGNVSMKRLVAKVILKYKVDNSFTGFTVTGVRLKNVPANIYFCAEPTTGIFPASATGSHLDYPAENLSTAATDGAYKKFVWYMPENLRNVISGVAGVGDRTLDKTDGKATYIEIKGTLKTTAKCEKAVYTILLGDPTTNKGDFNVKRNNVYTVTVNIQGTSTADKRITVEKFDDNNSAMLTPNGGTVTFDVRKCLANKFTTSAALTTLLTNKTWRVEVLWQDVNAANYVTISYNEPGQTDDKTLGLFTVKSTNATAGNAVVAMYDAATGGNILWSWHVWVTPYHPDGHKVYGLGLNSKASVPGPGEVHTYGTEFQKAQGGGALRVIMDRNLGATKTYTTVPAANDMTAQQAFGMFYQWGRKDPFPRATSTTVKVTAATTIPIYKGTTVLPEDGTGYKKVNITTSGVVKNNNTLEYSVKNPLSFIFSSATPYDWYATAAANQDNTLWGDGAGKSAYDPCPEGWRIAPNGTWSDFTRTAANAGTFLYYEQGAQSEAADYYLTNGRYYVPTSGAVRAWYPAPGFRDSGNNGQDGGLMHVGNSGYSWSSAVSGSNGVYLNFGA